MQRCRSDQQRETERKRCEKRSTWLRCPAQNPQAGDHHEEQHLGTREDADTDDRAGNEGAERVGTGR